jgi:2-desacetyl-2-hydroxyethyl bacteriochlorophyllide A dehydrogenase
MSRNMRAAVVDGRGGVDLQDRPVPIPAAGEVVIRPRATGVCGTDLHLIGGHYEHGRYPVVPGHEFAGDITAVGPGVSGLSEGDFVGVDPNVACGHCRWCRSGAKNLCYTLQAIGISIDGSCAEFVAVPANVTHRLSDQLDPASGALVEPLSCVLHAVERVPGWTGSAVVILGAGSIGLMAVAVANHLSAAEVHVVEPHALRRQCALQMGAKSAVVDPAELADLGEIDIALDASGHPAAIQSAIDLLGRRGRLIQMGVAAGEARVQLPPYQVFAKELSIIGSSSLATSYPAAAELMVDLQATLRPLVTKVIPLSQYSDAVRHAASPDAIKVQVVPDMDA